MSNKLYHKKKIKKRKKTKLFTDCEKTINNYGKLQAYNCEKRKKIKKIKINW